jgi:hypothetical protein
MKTKGSKDRNQKITINSYSKEAVYKINIKNQEIFYILIMNKLRKKSEKMIPFMIASKIKYLGINLTEKVKNVYNKTKNRH